MFKECLEGKPLSRVGRLFHELVPVASEAGIRDADERCAILLGREDPFHYDAAALPQVRDKSASHPLHLDAVAIQLLSPNV
jgi:hypothetical protein